MLYQKHLESLQGLCKDYVVFAQGFDEVLFSPCIYKVFTKSLQCLYGVVYKAFTRLLQSWFIMLHKDLMFFLLQGVFIDPKFCLILSVALLGGHLRTLLDCFLALAASHSFGSTRSTGPHLLVELLGSADALRFFRLRRRIRIFQCKRQVFLIASVVQWQNTSLPSM